MVDFTKMQNFAPSSNIQQSSNPLLPDYQEPPNLQNMDWLQNQYDPANVQGPSGFNFGNLQSTQAPATFSEGMLGRLGPNGFQQGWGMPALNAASGITNAYMGIKQFGLAKDSLKENKRQFDINYGSQKKLVNAQLEDRQNARVQSGNGGYESVSAYMQKNGIK